MWKSHRPDGAPLAPAHSASESTGAQGRQCTACVFFWEADSPARMCGDIAQVSRSYADAMFQIAIFDGIGAARNADAYFSLTAALTSIKVAR